MVVWCSLVPVQREPSKSVHYASPTSIAFFDRSLYYTAVSMRPGTCWTKIKAAYRSLCIDRWCAVAVVIVVAHIHFINTKIYFVCFFLRISYSSNTLFLSIVSAWALLLLVYVHNVYAKRWFFVGNEWTLLNVLCFYTFYLDGCRCYIGRLCVLFVINASDDDDDERIWRPARHVHARARARACVWARKSKNVAYSTKQS